MIKHILGKALMLRSKIKISKKAMVSAFCIMILVTAVAISVAESSSTLEETQESTNDEFLESEEPLVGISDHDGYASISIEKIKGGLGVSVRLKNSGDMDATDVDWSITVTRGRRSRILKEVTSSISSLAVGEEITVRSGVFLGLGKINITVTAGGLEERSEGRQLFIFTWVE